MNPIIFDLSEQDKKNLPNPVLSQNRVSSESLKAAECLLKTDGEGCFAQKQRQILAEILDEIDFSALIKTKIKKIENRTGVKSLALKGLEKTAQSNGWF